MKVKVLSGALLVGCFARTVSETHRERGFKQERQRSSSWQFYSAVLERKTPSFSH